jgi:hypothetical protein
MWLFVQMLLRPLVEVLVFGLVVIPLSKFILGRLPEGRIKKSLASPVADQICGGPYPEVRRRRFQSFGEQVGSRWALRYRRLKHLLAGGRVRSRDR